MSRATQAIQAMQGAQAAARAAAQAAQKSATLPTAIPNGLGSGGLLPNVPAGWNGASRPTQAVDSSGQTNVNINQNAPQAILNWTSFNVGARTTLTFDQHGNAAWVALNRVDASTGPSQILGNIKADGAIFVINQSGIIFGGASQINVGSLIASSAAIDPAQFLRTGIYSQQANNAYVPSFTGAAGKIIVEQGAQITTREPSSVTSGGGYVLLMGTEVGNAGSITTPNGQIEMAAGHDFVLRPGVGTDSNQYSTTRGNEIAPVLWNGTTWISDTSGLDGVVANTGLAFAQQGDITLAGHSIVQDGILLSTTSVNQRGTIHLLNSASDNSGSVTLTGNALTLILPELNSSATAPNAQRQSEIEASGANVLVIGEFDNLSMLSDRKDQSRIEIATGGVVNFQNGSQTMAQGGQVVAGAGKDSGSGRIFVETGATIDVSGVQDVLLPMSANQMQVNIQGNELRDSPQNRDSGNLLNKNVWIDMRDLILVPAGTGGYASDRYYTPGGLLEVAGYLANTVHTIGEWSAVGGTITLASSQVVAQRGSTFNVAGGSLQYQGGYLRQTYVLGSDGSIYKIDDVPANITVKAIASGFIVDHPHWGVTEIYQSPWGNKAARWEDGYTVGRDAGQLILSTPTAVFEGDILAAVIDGERQTGSRPAGVTDGYKLGQNQVALEGQLVVGKYNNLGFAGGYDSDIRIGNVAAVTDGMNAASALRSDRTNTVYLDAGRLSDQNLGGINLTSSNTVTVEAPVTFAPGAQITLAAPDIAINADVTAHGGTINLGNYIQIRLTQTQDPFWQALMNAEGKAQVTIGSGSTIDLSGLWVNQSGGSGSGQALLGFLNGGTLDVATTGGVTFAAGSTIDVSSGAAVLANGKTKGGTGGNVSLIANDDSRHIDQNGAVVDPSAPLVVDGKIIAYGFNGGGTLTLKAGQTVVIGEDASLTGGSLAADTPAGTGLRLSRDVVIPAGGKMPFDYNILVSSTPVDAPLATAYTPFFGGNVSIVTADSWTVPQGMWVVANGNYVYGGSPVPAAATVTNMSSVPVGTVIPSSVFPNGVPISPIVIASYKAGDVVPTQVTLPAGMAVPVGARFDQTVAIQQALVLDPDLFSAGFGNYAVSSNTGVEIAANIAATVPVYRFSAASYAAPTGSRSGDAADLWLPPTYLEEPTVDRLTQRAGANLTFSSLYDFNMTRGSSITVDPGQNVTIYANCQTTIEGSITAHGGNILLTSVPDAASGLSYGAGFGLLTPTRSIWIGDNSALDVSAEAVIATDALGHRYGVVTDGGSITLGAMPNSSVASDAFIILRPGSILDASGASGVIDVSSPAGFQSTAVASSGGGISLYSASGMYLDGGLRAAAGGAGASGGLLSINVLSHDLYNSEPTLSSPYSAGTIPEEMQRLRNITIVQHSQQSALAHDLRPGDRDPALQFGEATISVDNIHAGGFDQLALSTHDLFVFNGNVDLAMNRSIVLSGGVIAASPTNPHINVHLVAPYVKLDGWYNDPSVAIAPIEKYYTGLNTGRGGSLNTAADSSFRVDADLIDLSSAVQFGVHGHQGSGAIGMNGQIPIQAQDPVLDDDTTHTTGPHIVDAPGFYDIVLHSAGDVRLGTGSVTASNNLTIEAAQLYPLSGATNTITVGLGLPISESGGIGSPTFDPTAKLVVRKSSDAIPDVPPSVFGDLALLAPNIDQGGIVRAPLGIIAFNNLFGIAAAAPPTTKVIFRDGSLTSTSANGLTMPFGGTSDGVTYQGAGGTITNLGSMVINVTGTLRVETGLMIEGQTIIGETGSVLDVSGGGNLTGAGFISGRGGSVNILTTGLVNANPANSAYSAPNDKVYAIMPGYASAYAPVIATKGAGDPMIGQQITVSDGVAGLPAGTYTLLPSSYALLPGAYRVELGSRSPAVAAPASLPNGSVVSSAYVGFANTDIRDVLPTQVVLTSGQVVRSYSQYNETSYADFLRTQSTLFGGIRPRLPVDAGIVEFILGVPSNGKALSFSGTALFNGADDGVSGVLALQSENNIIDISAPGAAAIPGRVTVSSDDINAFNAATLAIGGLSSYITSDGVVGGRIAFQSGNVVNVLDGATLRAGQIFLVGPSINIAGGATLDTRGMGSSGLDSMLGYAYANTSSEVTSLSGPAVLAVANGWFNFMPFVGDGSINIDSGASLLTEGSIVLGAPGSLTIGEVNFGARYLSVTQQTVNIGTIASLGAAQQSGQLPSGWNLTQSVLDRLLHPSATSGVPTLEQLTIVAGGSVNFFGDVSLDARSQSANGNVEFVINSPALYGLAGAGETARVMADSFTWNGIRDGNGADAAYGGIPYSSRDPAVINPGGPGTGAGTLDIAAQTVLFGYASHSTAIDGASLNRYAIGFSNVNIGASRQIDTNSDGSLFVGQSRDANGNVVGGNLNVTTPLLVAQQGAIMTYDVGGNVNISAPVGVAAANTTDVTGLGGTLSFKGAGIVLDTAVALPSGKLSLAAAGDIVMGDRAVVDLSGRRLVFFDKNAYSWGGDLVLLSGGDISQTAGSLIDVSAHNNVAGTVTATATDPSRGNVLLNGALKGGSTGGYAGGQFTIEAQQLGDFAALNNKLNAAGFFGARVFDIKRGNLTIGNEVKANFVSISVDGGSLTVDGTVDASGTAPGTIRLAARDDLTLASTAVLDTHSTRLKTDSYGVPVEADNTSHIELSSAAGFVNLSGGAMFDMRSADNVARGKLEINAPRLGGIDGSGAGANDIAISAGATLNVTGAGSIAVNGFRTYLLPEGSSIDQDYLNTLDDDSTAFMNAALGNGALQVRLAGLAAYGSAFHLRPGVEIRSNGTLSTSGDLDFSGYRYGANADSAYPGSGEPGKLVIRAAGDLKINGSLTDGFAPPPSTPDEGGFMNAAPRTVAEQDIYPTENVRLAESWTIPNDDFYNSLGGLVFDTSNNYYTPGQTIPAGTTIAVINDYGVIFAWEAGLTIPSLAIPGTPRPVYALAQPLAPGSMSWSMRLVSGADVAAADSRVLRSTFGLNGSGNMTLNDLHIAGSDNKAAASVIRTGTGDLELLAGGNYTQMTPYGVYTAGTPIAETGTVANDPYNPARGRLADDGTILGWAYSDYESTLGPQYMYYMEHGGDLLLKAQGDINGSLASDSVQIGGWLWRQGGAELGQRTAWGINFGSYTSAASTDYINPTVHLSTFSGIGTLGGGDVNVSAGGNIGDTGLVFAVGGSGRVMADGSLVQTGGGTLSVQAGGDIRSGGNQFVNIRGDISIETGDFGGLYAKNFGYDGSVDPRPADPFRGYSVTINAGGSLAPGDGVIDIRARGDIAMGDIIDPGRVGLTQQTDASATQGGQAATWFTLWTQNTAVNMFGAGGTVSPFSQNQGSSMTAVGFNVSTLYVPSILRATAGNGDIYVLPGSDGASLMLPSPNGELDLLAEGSVIQAVDQLYAVGPLASSLSSLATPFRPGWAAFVVDSYSSALISTNYWGDPNNPTDSPASWKPYDFSFNSAGFVGVGGNPFVFGPNTITDASAFNNNVKSYIYAANGDILNLIYGQVFITREFVNSGYAYTTNYRGAKPVDIMAGGDIVNLKGLIVQNDQRDVSVIAAGGDIIYAGTTVYDDETTLMAAALKVAGPGTLEVSAGRNLYEGSNAAIESIGGLVAGDKRPGASIVLQAGVGAGTPGEGQVDWTGFARLYLDPANLAGAGPLADQPGKVARTYDGELIGWLKERFGYTGSAKDALSYFLALPAEQQRVFLRIVYYAELTAGGREYNDENGPRPGSYLRGREAIAALFPQDGAYQGDVTLFSAKSSSFGGAVTSGFVHTDFGGDIQFLVPGGGVTIGTDSLAPGADAGLITQGSGNIQIYSKESVLLGLSRIMTTFGGDVLIWSAEGDINAGRGSKTTVIFTPPRIVYDNYGALSLAPQTPSAGAGIATLAPIAEVPPGDIDLIAPLGTIDAGEAGIRVSGNVNLAALQVVNAANIQVQGASSGLPTVQGPPVAALASASNTAAATQQTVAPAQNSGGQASVMIVEIIGYGGGSGDDQQQDQPRKDDNGKQSYNVQPEYSDRSAVQIAGYGRLNEAEAKILTSAEKERLDQH